MSSGAGSAASSRSSSPHRGRPRVRHGKHRQQRISPGAAFAPQYTAQELHAMEVYDRGHSKSPPTCSRYARDARYEEINEAVVKRREDDADKSRTKAQKRHKHAVKVLHKARENERLADAECERFNHLVVDFGKRMKAREMAEKPQFRNRAEQEITLGIHYRHRPGTA